MFKLTLAALAATMLSACATTNKLNEPVRTQFYAGCMLQGGWPVSGCECLEQAGVKNSGISEIKPGDLEAGKKFSEGVKAGMEECRASTDALLKEAAQKYGAAGAAPADGQPEERTYKFNHKFN